MNRTPISNRSLKNSKTPNNRIVRPEQIGPGSNNVIGRPTGTYNYSGRYGVRNKPTNTSGHDYAQIRRRRADVKFDRIRENEDKLHFATEIEGLSNEIERAEQLIRYLKENHLLDCADAHFPSNPSPKSCIMPRIHSSTEKIKPSLTRRNHVSTYVEEDMIKSSYQRLEKEMELTYEECSDGEANDMYGIFKRDKIDLDTLIEWGNIYHEKRRTKCGSIDLKRLHHLQKPLKELRQMIGLTKFKESIVEQILLCLQGLHKTTTDGQEMHHTVIYGPPGVGKTHLAKILGYTYIAMGLIYKRPTDLSQFNIEDYFETASRSDLIGMYCGHTAVQTQKVIDKCRKAGKVLFIDETYSLGEKEGRDYFSKECIDTINKNLTEGAGEFICIIAGYPDDIQKCFFSHNRGLERRFNFRYTIDKYTPSELRDIFLLKLRENGWDLATDNTIKEKFFKENIDFFPNYGGDIITFLQKCKISHAKRIFADMAEKPKMLNSADIANGFAMYKSEKGQKDKNEFLLGMYS